VEEIRKGRQYELVEEEEVWRNEDVSKVEVSRKERGLEKLSENVS